MYKLFLIKIFLLASSIALGASELPTNIQKVAIMIASSKGMGKSSFGHAYLRLSSNEIWSDEDITVEFVANNENERIDIFRGIGIGENYKFAVTFEKYRNVKYFHNNLEERSITTYPLKLTKKQIDDLVANLSKLPDQLSSTDYTFFIKNCAYQVEGLLDPILNRNPVMSLHIPTLLDSKYKDFIDQKEIFTDSAASVRRAIIVKEKLPSFIKTSGHIVYKNIEEQLQDSSFSTRLIAVIKLLKLKNYIEYSKKDLKDLKIFLNIYLLLEKRNYYAQLLDAVNSAKGLGNDSFVLIPLTKSILEVDEGEIIDLKTTFIKEKGPALEVNFKTQIPDAYSKNRFFHEKKRVSLSEYDFTLKDGRLFYQDVEVSLLPSSNLFGAKNINLDSMIFSELVSIDQKRYLVPYVAIELKKNAGKKPVMDLSMENLISIKNFNYKGMGNCLSLVSVQKNLLEQVVFAPGESPLSPSENASLLKKATEGHFIIVPGFANIWDWTESIPEETLKSLIGSIGLAENTVPSAVMKFFTRTTLKLSHLEDMMLSLGQNITVPIYFRVEKTAVGHALLVYEIADRGDYYALGVYDPNLGISSAREKNPVHRIDKKSGLYFSDLYAKKGKTAYIGTPDIQRSLIFKDQQSRQDLQKYINFSRNAQRYYFTLNELL